MLMGVKTATPLARRFSLWVPSETATLSGVETDMEPITAAASDAPALSPTQAAAESGDFGAFETARSARVTRETTGQAPAEKTPIARVTKESAPADEEVPDLAPVADDKSTGRKLTRSERNEEYISKRIREGIEAGVAAIKGTIQPPPLAAKPETEKPATVAEWKRIKDLPDAPKSADFADYDDYTLALGVFVAETRESERAARDAGQRQAGEQVHATVERYTGFADRVTKAKEADPEFVAKLSDEFKGLYGMDEYHRRRQAAEQAGQAVSPPGPAQIVAECMYDSDHYGAMAVALSQPGAIAKLAEMPPSVARIANPVQRMHAHIDSIRRAFARLEGRVSRDEVVQPAEGTITLDTTTRRREAADKSVSKAPAPAPTFRKASSSGDSEKAAIDRGDFGAFDRQRMNRMVERRRGLSA